MNGNIHKSHKKSWLDPGPIILAEAPRVQSHTSQLRGSTFFVHSVSEFKTCAVPINI